MAHQLTPTIHLVDLPRQLFTPNVRQAIAPLAVEQGYYQRHISWPWWGITHTIEYLGKPFSFFLTQHVIVDLLLVSSALVLTVLLLLLRRWRETLYVCATFLVILCMPIHATAASNIDPLASAPRYLMVLFPLVLVPALWASTPTRLRFILYPLLILTVMLTIFLAAGIWIG
jgi:hypothetical protein